MKRILLLVFILTSVLSQAQNYNNEWIDYNKTYYKFKVGATGFYRISVDALGTIGLSNVNANHFQLWHNGVEVPLYTTSENAPLNAGGYLEFWGEMNDGLPDKPLYRQPEWQLNERASLQTDTSVYYLTINSDGNNRRLVTTVNDVAGNTLPAEPYLMYTVETNHKIRINPGRAELVGTSYTYSSSYDYGEGYTSAELISGGASYAAVYSLMRPYTGAGAPDPEFRIHASGNTVNPRYFRVLLNNDSLMGPTMDYFDYVKATQTFPISKIAASGSLSINVSNRSAVSGDRMVMHYMSVTYPRLFNFNAASVFSFSLPATAVGNFLVIDNFQAVAGTYPVLYDLTNGKRYVATTTTAPFRFRIDPSATTRQLILVNQSPSNFKAIGSFEQRDFINYGDPSNQGDFLIITNQVLTGLSGGADPVEDYRQYRSSAQGGGYAAKVYLIDQLEDQFAFGIKMHPLSIRNFVRWA
ncbi:MAG: hypothetical protein J0H92_00500, partial [Sphingobacteriales bacterium]|nr:hypothetical protein [Sphingobacteriales bacterium]